jgi:hypothetical protein
MLELIEQLLTDAACHSEHPSSAKSAYLFPHFQSEAEPGHLSI